MRTRVRNRPFLRAGAGGFDPGAIGDPILSLDLDTIGAGTLVITEDGGGRPLSDYAMIFFQFYDQDVNITAQLHRLGAGSPDTGANYANNAISDDANSGTFTGTSLTLGFAPSYNVNIDAWIEFYGFGLAMKTGAHSGNSGPGTTESYRIVNQRHNWAGICEGITFTFSATPGRGKGKAYGRIKGRKPK